MKKLLITLTWLISIHQVGSQPACVVLLQKNNHYVQLKKVWSDEFNHEGLDRDVWRTEYPWGRVLLCNSEQQLYSPENIGISEGKLNLIARNEPFSLRVYPQLEDSAVLTSDCNYDGIQDTVGINLRTFSYTSGMVYSKPTFKYGLFESRFKIPYGQGLWPAFWLFGHKGEIDVCEFRCHEPDKVHFDVHQGEVIADNGPMMTERPGGWIKLNSPVKDIYISMSVLWEENKVTWFINNIPAAVEYHRFDYPMSVVANLAIPGNCPNLFCPGPDENTVFPAVFSLDYFRVYQQNNDTIRLRLIDRDSSAGFDTLSEIIPVQHKKFLSKERKFEKDKETDIIGKISFYPDNQIIVLDLFQMKAGASVYLTNSSGLTLLEEEYPGRNQSINIGMLDEGEYLLTVRGRKNNFVIPFSIDRDTNN